MAGKKVIWVYKSGDVWVVRKDGAEKASAIRNTKNEAYEAARNIALNQNLTIKIQDGHSLKNISPRKDKDREDKDNNCFITTACVKYYGLNDDCYQLRTLRKFRDEYLLNSFENKILVSQYYIIAPKLVALLESDSNREVLFDQIFKKINMACSAIEKQKHEIAKAIYQKTVLYLLDYFKEIL